MAKEDLKPIRSTEEAKARGRLGGIASVKARREKKTLRETLRLLMDVVQSGVEGEKITTREAMALAMVRKALEGDVKAFEVIRDTIGEKPVDVAKIDLNATYSEMTTEEKEAALAAYVAKQVQ